MPGLYVRAEVEQGYNAVQRLLLDLERFGHALHALQVTGAAGDAGLMRFEAWVSDVANQSATVLSARLKRHCGVCNAVVSQAPRPAEPTTC